jgi:hypothetical protein
MAAVIDQPIDVGPPTTARQHESSGNGSRSCP